MALEELDRPALAAQPQRLGFEATRILPSASTTVSPFWLRDTPSSTKIPPFVQRIEIAEQPGAEHEMRLGDRDAGAESVSHRDFVVPLALKQGFNRRPRRCCSCSNYM